MNKPAPTASPSIVPILTVNFVGTLGYSIVLPFLVFLVTRLGGNAVIYGAIGATYSFFHLPYMNQPVSSDPESSFQVRLKGKTLKALMGPSAPYYGDHVELSDGGEDFASSVGVGAVIGTKFTWPPGAAGKAAYDLTPEREKVLEEVFS